MLKSVASGGGGGTADTTTFDDTGLEYVTGADVQEALENADAAIVAATKSPVNFRLQQLCNSVTNINSLWCSPIQSGSGATGFQGQISSVEASAQGGGIFIGEYGSTGTTSTGYGYLRIIGSQTLNVLGDGVVFGMEVLFRIPDLAVAGVQNYVFQAISFMDTADGTNDLTSAGEGFGLYYSTADANFQLIKRLVTTTSYVDTGVAVAADTWYKAKIEVLGAASGANVVVNLYLDLFSAGTETLVASTTGITEDLLCAFPAILRKTEGTTARLIYLANTKDIYGVSP